MIRGLLVKIRNWSIRKPTKKLKWTLKDYNMGKRWAMLQPHPFIKGKTLWDFVYDYRDSSYTIDNINKFLFSEF
jgi:hypothetical protein